MLGTCKDTVFSKKIRGFERIRQRSPVVGTKFTADGNRYTCTVWTFSELQMGAHADVFLRHAFEVCGFVLTG